MQKIYSLLRNNKQSGPYTLDELIALDLKPNDLIWAEGKTAGWCYPNEIAGLQFFLSNSNESRQKKESTKNIKEINESPEQNTSAARHIYVSLPSSFTNTIKIKEKAFPEISVSSSPVLESEDSPEAKLERKAKELKERIQAFSEQKKLPKGDNELDVKYVRSLDDIKNEYSSWLHDQKKKKRSLYQPLVLLSIGIIILLISFLSVYSFVRKESNSIPLQTAIAKKEIVQTHSDYTAVNTTDSKEMKADKQKVEKKFIPNEIIGSVETSADNTFDDTEMYKDSLLKAERKKQAVAVLHTEIDEQSSESIKEVSVANNPPKPRIDNLPSSEKGEQIIQTKKPSENNVNITIDKLIHLNERSSGKQRELTLHNSSSQALKFVAVDVYYYNANKDLLQKKTIYYQDIEPGVSVSLPIPEFKKTVSIQYHLGLISSGKGLYYAKH